MGTIYLRGKTYWVRYYSQGREHRESARSTFKHDAQRLLKRREGEIAEGKQPGILFDRIRFDELASDYLRDYRLNGRKSLTKARRLALCLSQSFAGMRAPQITTSRIEAYKEQRLQDGMSPASVNRELAALKRMLRLGPRSRKVHEVPYIALLKESAPRSGFFEHEQYLRLQQALPDYLQPVATFAYQSGWRLAEILNLTWDLVDLKEGTVRLAAGTTKNSEGRILYLTDDMRKLLHDLHKQRRLDCKHVFTRRGKPMQGFDTAWRTACEKAGLGSKLFHDFRRTAIRNAVRAGVPERVCMSISGHKTRSVFERYNIVSGGDLMEAARRQQAYFEIVHKLVDNAATAQKIIPLKQR